MRRQRRPECRAVPDGTRIGAQLRAARLAARKSMAEVAEQAGLTKGFVSKLERDLANVSVASLIRLCDALGVSVGSLFQASEGRGGPAGRLAADQLRRRKVPEYLLTPSREKRVQAILPTSSRAAAAGTSPTRCPADVEFVFVLAGRLQITMAGEHVTLEQGDAFTFPASIEHTFRRTGAGRTRVLWVVSPALPDTGLDVRPPAPATG